MSMLTTGWRLCSFLESSLLFFSRLVGCLLFALCRDAQWGLNRHALEPCRCAYGH